jgi:Tfp pilus assembly protein PilV
MRLHFSKSVTLFELLMAFTLISVMLLGFSSIELFSRSQVFTSTKRLQAQNDAGFILEHMSREISKTIGAWAVSGQTPLYNNNIGTDTTIEYYVDYNASHPKFTGNGKDRRVDGLEGDCWRAFRLNSTTYQMWYCPSCSDSACATCTPAWGTTDNILSSKIKTFTPTFSSSINYFNVTIVSCWNPAAPSSVDNPCITMSARIDMPSVSAR